MLVALVGCATIGAVVIARADPSTASPTATTPVVIVLDASGSMNTADAPGRRIDAAKQAVITLVRQLPRSARVGLVVYGTGTDSSPGAKAAGCRDIRLLAPVQRIDKAALIGSVRAVRARGYTPIGAALRSAAAALPAGRPGGIVLVSDGEDTCAPPQPCSVAARLKQSNRDLIVHTIGFRVGAGARTQLGCIARATGGTYRDAHDGAGLGAVLRTQVDAGLRPYVVSGTPINGTPTSAGAPVMAPGQYTDSFAPGSGATTKYYAIELTAPETFYVATTIVPPALRGGGTGDRLEVSTQLLNTGGDRCLSSEREHNSVLSGKVDPVTAVISGVVGGPSWSKRCSTHGAFLVAVTRVSASTTVTRSETIVRLEPPVDSVPPPAKTVPAGLAPPTTAAAHRTCVGGASFNTAPLLISGTCRDTLSTGETRYYRVHLAWGQRLAYQIVVDRVAGADHGTGYVQSAVATPLRQQVTLGSTSNASRDFGGPVSIAVSGSTLVPVEYGNRNSTRSDIRAYSLAGDYFISLGLTYPIGARPYRTGVQVGVRVDGAAQVGPHYLALPRSTTQPSAATSPAPSAVPSAPASAAGSASAATADPPGSGSSIAWVFGVIGGAVVVSVVVAMLVRTSRRNRRAQDHGAS